MNKLLKRIILPLFLLIHFLNTLNACTIFMYHKDGRTLFGNNEDYYWEANIWFNPGLPGELGRITFGWDNGWSQGGMNEAGLVFDWAATNPVDWQNSVDMEPYHGLVVRGAEQICELLLATCRTVEEAVDLFLTINVPDLTQSHIIITDSTGASAIVEWGNDKVAVWHRDTCYQICTNYNITSTTDPSKIPSRYYIAREYMDNLENLTVEYFRKSLNAVKQSGSVKTKYSNIYDLQGKKIYLYNNGFLDECLVLDLKTELTKGYRSFKIDDLFARISIWKPTEGQINGTNEILFKWSSRGAVFNLKYSVDSFFQSFQEETLHFDTDTNVTFHIKTLNGLIPDTCYYWKLILSLFEGFTTETRVMGFRTGMATVKDQENCESVFQVYPNPSDGDLHIVHPKGISEIRIIDLQGHEVIKTGPHGPGRTLLKFRERGNGLFIVRILLDGTWHSRKVIISKTQ